MFLSIFLAQKSLYCTMHFDLSVAIVRRRRAEAMREWQKAAGVQSIVRDTQTQAQAAEE